MTEDHTEILDRYKEVKTVSEKAERDRFTTVEQRLGSIPPRQYSGKRLLDLGLGSIGMLVFVCMYPFIALGIKLTSRGPVLFKQPRTGYKGEIFYCYKFRTMQTVSRQQKNGKPVVTQQGDIRIFPFGKFLRKANLDEFPQMINVIKGEMSLVGPRPYPVEECGYWDEVFEDHYYRYTVPPGVTGYAQVNGYRGGTLDEESMRERLDYDLIYTEKNKLSMDLNITLKTAVQMVTRKVNGH